MRDKPTIPSHDQGNMTREQEFHTEQARIEDGEENEEDEARNVSQNNKHKRQKVELQGEFRKIKHPLFDGKQEEAVEAWLINMNKYFQLYKYGHNLKSQLTIFQFAGKSRPVV